MSFAKKFEKILKGLLPTPFTIAILLTFLTFILALCITNPSNKQNHFIQLLQISHLSDQKRSVFRSEAYCDFASFDPSP